MIKKILLIISISFLFNCSSNTKESENKTKEKQDFTFVFEDTGFKSFYIKFVSDYDFQFNHVKFPLKGNYKGLDGERNWDNENWLVMNWDFRDVISSQNDSVSVVQTDSSFFFGSYCIDCGFSFEMEFLKIENDWFLVYRQENNF